MPSTGMLHQTAIRRNCHPLKAFNRKDRGVKTLLRKSRKRFALCSLRFSSRTLRLKAFAMGKPQQKALRDERSASALRKLQRYCTTNWNVAEEEVAPDVPVTVTV